MRCPTCHQTAREVNRVTLDNLLRDHHRHEVRDTQYFVCTTPGCATVYFDGIGHTFDQAAVRVPFGLKGNTKPVTVCYCFAFAAEDIHEEVELMLRNFFVNNGSRSRIR